MNLEDDLHRRTLERTSAPDGFADRVLARLDSTAAPLVIRVDAAAHRCSHHPHRGARRSDRASDHRAPPQRRGERARRQLMTALHIASAKMRVAQRAVSHD